MSCWKQFQSSFIISFKPDGIELNGLTLVSLRLLLLSDQAETLKVRQQIFCSIVGLNTAITLANGARNLLPNHIIFIMVI